MDVVNSKTRSILSLSVLAMSCVTMAAEPIPQVERARSILEEQVRNTDSTGAAIGLIEKYKAHLEKLKATAEQEGNSELVAGISGEIAAADGHLKDPASFCKEVRKVELQLPLGWQRINGSKEGAEEFGKALGRGGSEVDTARHDQLRIYPGINYLDHYLSVIDNIKGLDAAQNKRTTTTDVKHPGWPRGAFRFVSYTGSFRHGGDHFNSCQLLTDSAGQVVAFQLKNDGNRRATPAPGNFNYFNFVSSRRKGTPTAIVGRQTSVSGDVIVIKTSLKNNGRILESCVLFVPKPIAAICRKVVSEG